MNYFAYGTAAGRYARSRPYFHPLVVGKAGEFLRLNAPVALALDAGCGAGQSTLALKEIAAQVVGTDISQEMLLSAPRGEGIRYVRAVAEELPFCDASFDLLTVALAFHWFDRTRFLSEAARLLRASAWLVVYNNWFTGKMRENAEFEVWNRDVYLKRYPSPPRSRAPLDEETARRHGLRFAGQESFTNEVSFSVEELSDYLTSQSNIIAATEGGRERVEGVRSWLVESLAPMFAGARATFAFGGIIWYLQKPSAG